LRPALVGVSVGIIGCVGLLMLMAMVVQSADVPRAAILPLAIAAAAIGAFLAGLTAAAMAGQKGLLMGAACGLALWLLILLAGVARYTGVSGMSALIKLAALVLCGGIGGVLGVNMRKR
jgi:putative membrane protein (TIGR04086 family)